MFVRLIAPEPLYTFGLKPPKLNQSLTLSYLAALTPTEYSVDIVDGSISEIPFDTKPDVVGISFISSSSLNAYAIADKYRRLGVTVVLGGFHVSIYPDEALEHADAVVVGEAENVWVKLLNDVQNDKLKPVYKSDTLHNLTQLPLPRYDFYNQADYNNSVPVFISRGCPYRCNFCSIKTVYGPRFRLRPIDDVVAHIKTIKDIYWHEDQIPPLSINFVDDNLWGDAEYAKELFKRIAPLNIYWSSQVSLTVDEELVHLAAKSGCSFVFMGFESLDSRNLDFLNKKQNKIDLYEKSIATMHKENIVVGGFFMFGLPYDDENCFVDLTDFLEKNCVETIVAAIFQPIPGTEQYDKWEGKDECKDYSTIMQSLPIYYPQSMTKQEFKREFLKFSRRIYSDASIDMRLNNCINPGAYFINKGQQDFFGDIKMDEWADLE